MHNNYTAYARQHVVRTATRASLLVAINVMSTDVKLDTDSTLTTKFVQVRRHIGDFFCNLRHLKCLFLCLCQQYRAEFSFSVVRPLTASSHHITWCRRTQTRRPLQCESKK